MENSCSVPTCLHAAAKAGYAVLQQRQRFACPVLLSLPAGSPFPPACLPASPAARSSCPLLLDSPPATCSWRWCPGVTAAPAPACRVRGGIKVAWPFARGWAAERD